MFLSQDAKNAYFEMMNALDDAAGRKVGDDTAVEDHIYEAIFRTGEQLRLQLAADVGTGQQPRVISSQLRPPETPESMRACDIHHCGTKESRHSPQPSSRTRPEKGGHDDHNTGTTAHSERG
ncbi:hypothetical protein [Streptosporangium sp. NPDC000509]|uniref:hypothetical protein n=1 Tax=Streptosporangium sp. NPDC000509 TaxID=3366186 RepID=UPI00369C03FA